MGRGGPPRTDEILVQKKLGSGGPSGQGGPPDGQGPPPGVGINTLYLSRDGLGSTSEVTLGSGSVLPRYSYDAFGAVTVLEGNSPANPPRTNYLFTGRAIQWESGLYNYRNRFYHPGVGRFLQPDPIGFLGGDINLYTYVANNPANLIDPFGLCEDQAEQDKEDMKKKFSLWAALKSYFWGLSKKLDKTPFPWRQLSDPQMHRNMLGIAKAKQDQLKAEEHCSDDPQHMYIPSDPDNKGK